MADLSTVHTTTRRLVWHWAITGAAIITALIMAIGCYVSVSSGRGASTPVTPQPTTLPPWLYPSCRVACKDHGVPWLPQSTESNAGGHGTEPARG